MSKLSTGLGRIVYAAFVCFCALIILGVFAAEASPAYPVVQTFEQPDGTLIQLRLWGDEFANGWETITGYTVVKDPDTGYWVYAVQDESGHLLSSGVVPGRGEPPAGQHLRPSESVINAARAEEGAPPLGEFTYNSPPPWAGADTDVLFIMVDFTDVACTFDSNDMQDNLFGGNASGPGDLDDYFDEISDGDLQLDGTVVGCYTLSDTKNHYDSATDGDDELVEEAIALADPDVDYSNFDNDGNGTVDALGIIYAGGGPHDGCDTDDPPSGSGGDELWPHSTSLPGSGESTDDGVKVDPYIIQSEITFGISDSVCDEIQTIGLFAHEFGHSLGLPDLYDTDGSSEGVGFWSTMGSQYRSTVNLADTPPHYDPWSKWFLEWLTPDDLTDVNTTQTVPEVGGTANNYAVQLLDNPGDPHDWVGSGEYFLVENRQQVGFDSQLPGCGILIWHIDEAQSNNKNEGHTSGSHRLVDVEEADGNDDLDQTPPASNRGDAGDPYPGSSNNTLFDDTTYPHANLYDGSNSGVRVEMVDTACSADMLVNFGQMPTADAGGPYATPEGTDVMLDASGSTPASGDPGDAIDSYEWDLDDDGMYDDATGVTATFDMVGQDGVFTVGLRVTTVDGAVDTDTAQVTVTNVAPSVINLATDAPQDEGSAVSVSGTITDPGWLESLTGTIDWDDGAGPQPISGALENTLPDATLTFDVSNTYGDNGVYNVEVCGSDDDTTTCETIDVVINNVAPSVTVTPVGPIDEGQSANVEASFTDPGWLDTYTYEIDWGWSGFPADAGVPTVDTEGPPMDIGSLSGTRQYGDDGVFTIEVTVTDDDGGVGTDSFELTVNNVDPTAEIDESGTVLINGMPTFLAHAGDPIDFEGRSTDPGSDDLTLTWDWDDGAPAPDVSTEYLLNPPNPDPDPSPTVNPRDVTDMQTHAFEDACIYEIVFAALDDDGGSADDTANVLIVGNADELRTGGYWMHQYRGNGKTDFTDEELECYLAIVDFVSNVFHEETDASTIEKAVDVLFVNGNKGSMEEIFDRQLLAAWLNFANGAVEWDEMIDTDGDGTADTAFSDVMTTAESVRLGPHTRDELEAQKDILERINEGAG